ncbi:NADP-dependent oxidoreductase domain-containing protein [Desarmillaria ectypa]|nr:NADP-dependent oxidoreductase domain-containing protein [Desarmillaria ectypa]
MFHREQPEKEYAPLYKKYGLRTAAFSVFTSGILTGKYNDGIALGTRLSNPENGLDYVVKALDTPEGKEKIRKVRELTKLAQGELQTTPAALALAWVARNPNTSTVILGASRPEQVLENLKALEVLPKLTEDIMSRIEEILDNKPALLPTYERPPLDKRQ